MLAKIALVVALGIVVASSDSADSDDINNNRECLRQNEVYYECRSPCAKTTCASLAEKSPEFCIESCAVGCGCKPGFYLNTKGQCIPEKLCYACPGANEEFRTGLSSSCDIPNCRNPDIIKKRPQVCTKDSRSECVCINMTVRHPNGTCVPPEECPPKITPIEPVEV